MPADRVIVVQEAAFPSGALPPESTPGATPENQKLFVQRLIESGIPFVYRFAFDAWFAQQSSPPGALVDSGTTNSCPSRSSRCSISGCTMRVITIVSPGSCYPPTRLSRSSEM
jgi:hypothetical protein